MKADKGNVTVAVDRDTYMDKMSVLLSDQDTYKVVKKDPTRNLINQLHVILMRWKKNNYISLAAYRSLNCTDGVLPRAYGLPKVYKPSCPLRVIVSSKNTPLYYFSKFLHRILYKAIPRPDSNSFG